MQELQEERKRLQMLEQVSSANLAIDKSGNLVVSGGIPSTGVDSSSNLNDAMTAAMIAAEEQAAVASVRRLRRRDEKGDNVSANGLAATSMASTAGNAIGQTVTGSTSASRRKQVNNIYTYSNILLMPGLS